MSDAFVTAGAAAACAGTALSPTSPLPRVPPVRLASAGAAWVGTLAADPAASLWAGASPAPPLASLRDATDATGAAAARGKLFLPLPVITAAPPPRCAHTDFLVCSSAWVRRSFRRRASSAFLASGSGTLLDAAFGAGCEADGASTLATEDAGPAPAGVAEPAATSTTGFGRRFSAAEG